MYIHYIFLIITYCSLEKNTPQQIGPSQRYERTSCKVSIIKMLGLQDN